MKKVANTDKPVVRVPLVADIVEVQVAVAGVTVEYDDTRVTVRVNDWRIICEIFCATTS